MVIVKRFFNNIYDILEQGKQVGSRIKYINLPMSFDIESSSFYENDEKRAIMYAWVFGINGKCIRGRTWNEFLECINILSFYYNTDDSHRIIIYIHNLEFEFQFFRKLFKWNKVFAIEHRKTCYAVTTQGIEFRCSYILSGYSLEKVADNLLKYKIKKLKGNLNYDLVRHSETEVLESEWEYILNDGLIVMCFIQEQIELNGDISKIPLTKTSYVRRRCKKYCYSDMYGKSFNEVIKHLTLTTLSYKCLRYSYMGGFTHANYNYVGRIIKDVYSFDFTSSYPAVMLSEKFPMSKPISLKLTSKNQFYNMLKKYCCMFRATFYNIQSTVSFENYISISKCIECVEPIVNNGRLICAEKITIFLTEQDFNIIEKMYKWDTIEINNFMYFYKEYLPKPIIEMILDLYHDKTTLKGIEGKEIEYLSAKADINSVYGMCVTDICRDEYIYVNDWVVNKNDIDKSIKEYNSKKNRTLYYPWGVWVTAYARANLFNGILNCRDDYIYSDTDSIKIINYENHKSYFDTYNKYITQKINKCLDFYGINREKANPKTIKGIYKPIGVWDYECKYDRFKTLGAKRYITEINQDINITIAGVSKIDGKKYLYNKYKTNDNIFNAFSENLLFPSAYIDDGKILNGSGKLCHTYIDNEISGLVKDYNGVYSTYHELSSIHLEPTEYNMSLTAEFKNLLYGIRGSHLV